MSTTPGLGTGLYSSTSASYLKDDVDDSALDNALSDDEEDGIDSINLGEQLAKIESMPPSEVPPREGLYSTPLSWEKPQPGLRTDPLLGSMSSGPAVMSEDEQRRLLAIAMNPGSRPPPSAYQPGFAGFGFGYPGLSGGFPTLGAQNLLDPTGLGSAGLGPLPKSSQKQSSQPTSQQPPQQTRAQQQQTQPPGPSQTSQNLAHNATPQSGASGSKAGEEIEDNAQEAEAQTPQLQRSNTGAGGKAKDKVKPGDRTAHNDIERKYRTNLKDKIAELRDAVPALKGIPEEGGGGGDEGEGTGRAPKVSKVGEG
jgi:hypothetical protein